MGTYVKTGIAGYGPDLDVEDTPYESTDDMLEGIRYELSSIADMLADEAGAAGEAGEFEDYYNARELADKLEGVRANLDPERRNAPLFNGPNAVDFDSHIREWIDANFPMDVSTNGAVRLYVWDVED